MPTGRAACARTASSHPWTTSPGRASAEPHGVLAAVEATSWDSDTNARDRIEKAHAYAACGIGAYLLVDRDDDSVTVHSEPEDGRYRNITKLGYGHTVDIADVGITLNTDGLKRYGS